MYVCMYVCMYACMCVNMYESIHIHIHICMHIHLYIYIYIYIYIYTYTNNCMYRDTRYTRNSTCLLQSPNPTAYRLGAMPPALGTPAGSAFSKGRPGQDQGKLPLQIAGSSGRRHPHPAVCARLLIVEGPITRVDEACQLLVQTRVLLYLL